MSTQGSSEGGPTKLVVWPALDGGVVGWVVAGIVLDGAVVGGVAAWLDVHEAAITAIAAIDARRGARVLVQVMGTGSAPNRRF
ncbi:MAG: hypothetical protein ACR2P0_21125 [Acidimicrobiales bacterium]